MKTRNLCQVFNECKNCGWQEFGPTFWDGNAKPSFPVPAVCPECAEHGEAGDSEIEQDVVDAPPEWPY